MKKGDIVKYYHAKIYKGCRVETDKQEHKILAVNDEYVCIDDFRFTSLEIKLNKYSSNSTVDRVSICDWSKYRFDDHIFTVSIYTATMSQKAISGKMTRKFKAYLEEKLSVYLYGVDIKITF